jgi:hypothetical protein
MCDQTSRSEKKLQPRHHLNKEMAYLDDRVLLWLVIVAVFVLSILE